MKYQVLVLDLDGTLTNSKKEITAPTKQALLEIQEAGRTVVLASGRRSTVLRLLQKNFRWILSADTCSPLTAHVLQNVPQARSFTIKRSQKKSSVRSGNT